MFAGVIGAAVILLRNVAVATTYPGRSVRTLLIDNYDSYTYNVWQLLAEVNLVEPYVIHNDDFTNWATALATLPSFDNIVISPGPGNPQNKHDFGICAEAIRQANVPILGICLGHQGIAHVFGGAVGLAPMPIHGRLSKITHTGRGLFEGVDQGTEVVRYHSLIAELPLSPYLTVTATSDDGLVMGLEHVDRPIHGVQFHPESIATINGRRILNNFKELTLEHMSRHESPAVAAPSHSENLTIASREVEAVSVKRELPRRFVHIARKQLTLVDEKKDLERLFESMYGSSPASFWLDSALPLADYEKCGAVASGSEKDVESSPEVLSYMGALDSADAFVAEYNGANKLEIRRGDGNVTSMRQSIFDFIDRQLRIHNEERDVRVAYGTGFTAGVVEPRVPFDYNAAMFGYMSYEVGIESTHLMNSASRSFGPRRGSAGTREKLGFDFTAIMEETSDLNLNNVRASGGGSSSYPVAVMICPSAHLVFDHRASMLYSVAVQDEDDSTDPQVDVAKHLSEKAWALLGRAQLMLSSNPDRGRVKEPLKIMGSLRSRKSYQEYRDDIEKCLNYIQRGETYEVCLTAEFTGKLDDEASAWNLYRNLRENNPAPYSCYFHYNPNRLSPRDEGVARWCRPEGLSICCSSPERYLKIDKSGFIESKPIKGTAKRDLSSPSLDQAIRDALQDDEKTRSENLMIVDLVRNDIGRVCEVGTVQVPTFMAVETYATVHQMVSTIRGKLRASLNVADALVATFPGGSMTGSPKQRTMAIIADLEKRSRGVYSGTVGVIGLNGACDLNIVIRSAVVEGRDVSVGAGGAIVALSDSGKEIDEVLLKAHAVSKAIGYSLGFAESNLVLNNNTKQSI